jgi:hypothetical protein
VEGAVRDVVIVEAGLLLVVPADQPHVDDAVALQLHVVATVEVVLDQVGPAARLRRDPLDHGLQLRRRQLARVRLRLHIDSLLLRTHAHDLSTTISSPSLPGKRIAGEASIQR